MRPQLGVAGATRIADGTLVLVDGDTGEVIVQPDVAEQATAMHRDVVLVGLGDPRWVQQLAMTVPTVIAWSGDRVMQQAAGRGLLRTKK
jgi:hypothetical protein